ncbi:unnamed protein product [Bemisia tabaci]|uniref:Uncharacterized protein n=1 Tax=Bemisia tabaci TaxID=7038 RepID=A0A9P0AGC5_BEMTA|nr:unnamed protein product [Bemisia tabaci]
MCAFKYIVFFTTLQFFLSTTVGAPRHIFLKFDAMDFKVMQKLNVSNLGPTLTSFKSFKNTYKRQYKNFDEYLERFNIFRKNLDAIEELKRKEKGTAKYGITQYADLTPEEFDQRYNGLRMSHEEKLKEEENRADDIDIKNPAYYDWRRHGAVTPVKQQGSCFSCWAFSTTGNIEGLLARKTGNLVTLSEQELVDCDSKNHGCMGGYMTDAVRELADNLGGLVAADDYPYLEDDSICILNRSQIIAEVKDVMVFSKKEENIAKWMYKLGPLSAGINARPLQWYLGGIMHPSKEDCSPSKLNHGVLIVGYGIQKVPEGSIPYWTIKNSWGTEWGEKGYFKVYRGDGTCGINEVVSSAVMKVDDDDDSEETEENDDN